jgi:uncharacterized protein (TIGR04255 family)
VPFRPLYDRHAIKEVVFALTLKRQFEPEEVKAVMEAHERWREELPKISPTTAHRVVFGNTPLPPDVEPYEQLGIAGVLFEALKRDGSLDWRLRLEQNWIAVNCLSYTRWADIWPTAKNLLDQVCAIVVNPKLPVVGAALQYIDEFVWEGDIGGYTVADLLRDDSELLPGSIRTKGALWHVHQGWFQYEDLSVPGRCLHKVHIDGVERDGKYVTRIDTTLRHDLADELTSYTAVFGSNGKRAPIDSVFGEMHDESKRLMASFITEEMAERIDLSV